MRFRRTNLVTNIGLFVLVAMLVAATVSWMREVNSSDTWAEVEEYHAAWDQNTGQLWQSVLFVKHEDCDRVIVSKQMRQIVNDDVIGDPVMVNGTLSQQMQRVSSGSTAHLFDRAKPRTPLAPGKYLVTMVAICEKDTGAPTGPMAMRALPVDATVMVAGDL